MITLVREPGSVYVSTTGTVPLTDVAVKAKPMPDAYINAEGNFVTEAFFDYLQPLIGEMPKFVALKS